MKVWIVVRLDLDGGPEAWGSLEAAFSTRERAQAYADQIWEEVSGTKHWWGYVRHADDAYEIVELEVDEKDTA